MIHLLPWIDLETTGLDPTTDYILEIGMAVTDLDLNIVDAAVMVIDQITPVEQLRENCVPFVQEMHDKSGLWDAIRDAKPSPITGMKYSTGIAQEFFQTMLKQHFGDFKPPLCGSSVGFDRAFLANLMGTLHNQFSYRNIDVSSIKELAQRWAPDVFASRPGQDESDKEHRAIPDIQATLAELRHYVSCGFIQPMKMGVIV